MASVALDQFYVVSTDLVKLGAAARDSFRQPASTLGDNSYF